MSLDERTVQETAAMLGRIRDEVSKVVVGQGTLVDRLLLALVADGHVLIEGIPGLAKTTAVKALAGAVETTFSRIQFTPDLLPADLTGTEVYRPQTGAFTVKKGPLFASLVLADEVNRAPAKVQSALLEAMQERQVTLGDTTHALPSPFLVLATQNPIEQEGTYPLPEAQVDRFMLKLTVDYPDKAAEKEIMRRMSGRETPRVSAVVHPRDIMAAREVADAVHLDTRLEDYIVDLVFATRKPEAYGLAKLSKFIAFGASPRASIALVKAARVHALMQGRTYATPHDVKTVAPDVLRHRVLPTYEAEAQELTGERIVRDVLASVDVP
ncbi:MAG: AAA family ATPase [Myxococcota bacterium]|nr:MoxR family ATPase [Myxococcota bacterium]